MRGLIFRSNNCMNVLIIKNYIGLVERRGKIDLGPVNVVAYALCELALWCMHFKSILTPGQSSKIAFIRIRSGTRSIDIIILLHKVHLHIGNFHNEKIKNICFLY